jgi:3'-phosphoadenosine 5'-phosphosulfate sulfotransferase (PAPS reductase)/FAD synthetase
MHDPFKIDSPTCISFSGGRTSAYMLWRVLQSNGGLPAEAVVCFANTGKEVEETLKFVAECERRWSVPINWIEYRGKVDDEKKFALVNYETASRHGEPFEQLILDRKYLPNPFARFCTSEMKVRVMHRYLKTLGFEEWDSMLGIRADEPRRVAKIRARPSDETPNETKTMPLAEAGVGVQDVLGFWRKQDFDLELLSVQGNTMWGNCDLCYLKSAGKLQSLIQQQPERAVWWAKQEQVVTSLGKFKGDGARFHSQRPSYEAMRQFALRQGDWVGNNQDESIDCFCGD